MNKLMQFYQDFKSKHKRLCEIIRFVIVGGLATVIDMFVMGVVLYCFDPKLYPNFFNVFYGSKAEPRTIATVFATGIGFVVSLIFNYVLSVLFVYEDKGNSKTVKGVVLFAVLSVCGLLINMGGMWLFNGVIHINEWIVKIVMTLVVLVFNYITRKLFIFKKTGSGQPAVPSETTTLNEETATAPSDTLALNEAAAVETTHTKVKGTAPSEAPALSETTSTSDTPASAKTGAPSDTPKSATMKSKTTAKKVKSNAGKK